MTYVPSLCALRACISRTSLNESQRKGVALRSLIDPDLDFGDSEADALTATLGTKSCKLAPVTASFWTDAAAAQVLHIVAHTTHNARMPFDSLIGPGWLDLSVGELIAGLDLPQCEIVSNVVCESAFPSTLRAPGLDLSAVFLAAGARSVLASTWVVRDDLASELAQLFFSSIGCRDTIPRKHFSERSDACGPNDRRCPTSTGPVCASLALRRP